jgi:hypothetical protein
VTPGGVATVDGNTVSLASTGGAVIVNGQTSKAAPTTLKTSTASLINQPPITSVVIAGQTLTAGGRITVGGDVLSLAPSGTGIIVIGTVTIGGGESTATATGKKKNAGARTVSEASIWGMGCITILCVFHLLI